MNVVHGGLDPREVAGLGFDPAAILDLSANLHPEGTSEAMRTALGGVVWDRYPAPDASPVRDAIAKSEGVAPARVLPVPGATAGIHLIARAFAPGERAVILGPTFGEYRAAVAAAGGEVVEVSAEAPAFEPPVDRVPAAALGFLCNPNNPTGAFLGRRAVEDVATSLGGLLVVDAAYEPFTSPRWNPVDMVRAGGNVLVVRSMTKLHAIPGVRLGYVVGQEDVIARLRALQHSWALDAAACTVAPVALGEAAHRVRLLEKMRATREDLRMAMMDAGRNIAPSEANFVTVHVGDAARVRAGMLRRGVLVRDCTSFGLPDWVRIAVPRPRDRDPALRAFLDALREVA